ncbi:MAG: Gfo/Idh/MocA family oxidoreductase [Vampirovibrionales bacterium]|nr:Gfo/Idh/MocA family oxidoreductase [Vampirovibrionales bacterium]
MTLKLGILGLSDGNGHPYSWSAIFNGYDPVAMAQCPFPVIPAYLAQQRFPDDAIEGARVHAIWTQDRALSRHISQAAYIPHVCEQMEDMLPYIDAVLLARDDAECHEAMARPFLEKGLPIYIDKPIATSVQALDKIYARERYSGQIFTCSALRYARELQLTLSLKNEIGAIRVIRAQTPKDWTRYGIHIIEPVVAMLGADDAIDACERTSSGIRAHWRSGVVTEFIAMGADGDKIEFHLTGEKSGKTLTFTHTFDAFRAALQAFIDVIENRRPADNKAFIYKTIQLVEAGCDAFIS